MSIKKPLIHYSFYKEVISFIRKYWEDRKYFCQPYILCYPKLNKSIKWQFDYIIAFKKNYKTGKDIKMDALLDRFYEDIEYFVKNGFKGYIIKVSELNSSFFVLLKRYRGKILGDRQKKLFDDLKAITEDIYKDYALKSKEFEREYFPYFKLVKNYGNYQFHFLVIKKD